MCFQNFLFFFSHIYFLRFYLILIFGYFPRSFCDFGGVAYAIIGGLLFQMINWDEY